MYSEEYHAIKGGGGDLDIGKASMELTPHRTKMISLVLDAVPTVEERVKRRIGIFLGHFRPKILKSIKN